MKSPVWGFQRGRTTSKRTIHASAGNVHLKGKKTKRMGCGCCDCVDKRDEMLADISKREMKDIE